MGAPGCASLEAVARGSSSHRQIASQTGRERLECLWFVLQRGECYERLVQYRASPRKSVAAGYTLALGVDLSGGEKPMMNFDGKAAVVTNLNPVFETEHGQLYEADCVKVMSKLGGEIADTIFADPPFNLNKMYGIRSSDGLTEKKYLEWCRIWMQQCVRLLKPGGSFFLYNLPKWNVILSNYLLEFGLEFRHWIAVEQKNCLPIQGRLYPAHYSLIYFTKGRPNTFNKIRTPIETCRHCSGELRDYGGHRGAMNPNGVNLKDIWTDIPPVRHKKFKPIGRSENALSTKLLERVVELSTLPGDLVIDPFGGSGTTYAVCEKLHRRWIGCEIEDVSPILARLSEEVQHHRNTDYVEYPTLSIAAE